MDISWLPKEELISLKLREIFEKSGYKKFKMTKFEEYQLYVEHKSLVNSEKVITFTDTDGKLMALKPDVTISIAKNCSATPEATEKLYYNENVYRTSKETHLFEEINQIGIECLGKIDVNAITEVTTLAWKSLNIISKNFMLDIAHIGILQSIFELMNAPVSLKETILRLLNTKNVFALKKICAESGVNPEYVQLLLEICGIRGDIAKEINKLKALCVNEDMKKSVNELLEINEKLIAEGCKKNIMLDFSIISNVDYYNGIFMHGYVKNLPRVVLSGGQYDNIMKSLNKKASAIGFALYMDELEFEEGMPC